MATSLLRAFLISSVLALPLLAGAQQVRGAKPADYKLGPGDEIKVQVYQSPDLTLEARVSESGVINYPLVGRVSIGGLSIPDAEARIAQALKRGNILKAPQVNINLVQVR